MPEKLVWHQNFLPVFCFLSPAYAFRHKGQYGTAGNGLVRHQPPMNIEKQTKNLPHKLFKTKKLDPGYLKNEMPKI
jgi:hypothetical protein